MLSREEALTLLDANGVKDHLLQHCMASESVMKGLAEKFGEDAELWGRTGLLHDIDWPATEAHPAQHGLKGAELLQGKLPEEALQAIRAHNSELNGTPVKTRFDVALRCGETVTGLVTAAALVRPTGITGMQVKSLKKKMKDKAFAAGVNRDIIRTCPDMGLTLEDFLQTAIDAMTPETTCLSSIWETDEKTRQFLTVHGRAGDYKPLHPAELAYYDGVVSVDLSKIRPMIALPMHPSNAFTIEELNANLEDILHACEQDVQKLIGRKDVQLDLCSKIENGKLRVDQGVIAGCAGGLYDSIYEAASILKGHTGGCGDYALSVYPGSQPIMMELVRTGVIGELMASGATIRTAFCGPCFGAGDVPANGALSIRHTTRNFPSREGSKPGSGQLSGVALMDARSIAATTANGGILTPATDIDYDPTVPEYQYDASSYDTRVYQGFGKGDYDALLKLGPNIKDWPEIAPLGDNLLLKVASYITDPVTTTDELIPSGETSSYRSDPLKLASFALSRRDPDYVPRARATQALEETRRSGAMPPELQSVQKALSIPDMGRVQIGSVLFANKPGDGSAREQAASCQRVLGGCANLCYEFATKRYRSNCVNWGMLPFTLAEGTDFPGHPGDFLYVPQVREKVTRGDEEFPALLLTDSGIHALTLYLKNTTAEERELLLTGCLMNHYAAQNAAENRR